MRRFLPSKKVAHGGSLRHPVQELSFALLNRTVVRIVSPGGRDPVHRAGGPVGDVAYRLVPGYSPQTAEWRPVSTRPLHPEYGE